ncbi:MAG TPA: SIMPL domain-containing protein [Candidatus Paceibacterota bacterium]|nr:SIMPL domain-containing protein [Candidatus Paceibacterota bacterium]
MNESKFWFWILLDALLAALFIGIMGIGFPAVVQWAASVPPARTITVTAQGMTTATPDLAEITFSVVSQGQNPQTLTSNNTDKMNAVLQFVSSENIASSDIATTGYDLEPTYQYDSTTQTSFITGYTLTQTVTVKIHDLSNVATVLGGLTPLGVNQVGGVDFTFNDPDTFLAVARADAMNKAETKAVQMASEAGASLGEVVNVSENGIVPGPIPVYNVMASTALGASAPASTPNIQPGSQEVTDNVTITYALR